MKEKATIYHNPKCGTSRNVLALLKFAGLEVEVIEYLKTPPSKETLKWLIEQSGLTPQEALRKNVPEFTRKFTGAQTFSDDAILDAMILEPILINRPFVMTSRGVRLARPSEKVLEILPVDLPGPFTKEDGQVIPS